MKRLINKLKCWWYGHSYAVFHYFTGGRMDDITCSRCSADLVFSEKTGWWITKEK